MNKENEPSNLRLLFHLIWAVTSNPGVYFELVSHFASKELVYRDAKFLA